MADNILKRNAVLKIFRKYYLPTSLMTILNVLVHQITNKNYVIILVKYEYIRFLKFIENSTGKTSFIRFF